VAPEVLFVRPGPIDPLRPADAAPEDGTAANPFGTLAQAVRAARAGALIRLGQGVYREAVVVDKPLVMLGLGPGKTRLVAPPGTGAPIVLVQGGARVELRHLSIEDGVIGLAAIGGGARLQDVALRNLTGVALAGREAEMAFLDGEILRIGGGPLGGAVEIDGGSLEMRRSVLRDAGRRAIQVRGGRGLLDEVDASGSPVAALQAIDGAEVAVVAGRFAEFGGAALYAGGAKLSVRGASISRSEYAVIGFRGAELELKDVEISDTRVAGVAFVRAQGFLEGCTLRRGGIEGAVAVTNSTGPVRLSNNRFLEPGRIGVHVTGGTVVAKDNTISSARLDAEGDLGDGIYAVDATLALQGNSLRGNAGSGVTVSRTRLELRDNLLTGNGRAGVVLLDRSTASADRNVFDRNRGPGLQVAELSTATLLGNRFGGNALYQIDPGCDGAGKIDLRDGNTFLGPAAARRTCP